MTSYAMLAVLLLSPVQMRTYVNARFGYSVDVPANLSAGPESENADGRVYSGKGTIVTVYGSYGVLGAKEEYKMSCERWAKSGKISHKEFHSGYFLISGQAGKRLFSQKTLTGKEVFATVSVEYPASQSKSFAPTLSHILKSLKL
jgi:hypothetical protein